MEDNNTNRPEDKIQGDLNKVGKGAKKVGGKALKAGVKVLKAGAKSAKAVGIIGSLGAGGLFAFIGFIVLLIFVIVPSMKSYDPRYTNNTTTTDISVSYNGEEPTEEINARSRAMLRSIGGTSVNEVSYGESRVVLSEENQAIENYHYYQSMKSLYNNKYYYPIEGVDLEGVEGEATMEVLLEKGVFIENKEKNVIEFNEKYIGALKKVDEEKDKIKVQDEYGREVYFQLPEELLGMLNTTVYNGKVVYDKPFLQGVDFKYYKTEDKDLGRPVYEYSTDYSSLATDKVNEFGLGSVFIYKPTFELEMEGDKSGAGGTVDGLLYMGDSLFEGMSETGLSKDRIVATKGYAVKKGLEEHLPKVIEKKPRMVVTSYGSNDCVGNVDLEQFYSTYKELVEGLKKDLPDTNIYLTALNMSESKYANVAKYNEKIKAVAEETGAKFIDSRELFKDKEDKYFQTDKLHFKSSEGLAYWREDIEKKIGVDGDNKDETVTEDVDTDQIKDVKLKYLLDSVITFAGVYKFEYEIEAKGEDGYAVNQKEKPSKVIRKSKDEAYIYKYLENFSVQVPKKLYDSFEVRHMVRAFKGEKGSLSNKNTGDAGVGDASGGGDLATVEQWRPMVEEIAATYGINPNVILSMIWSESSGNPHAGNANYKGLVAMGANHDWLKPYFIEGDEANIGGDYRKTGTSNDPRVPSCPSKGPHNDAEHERAARFQIHYACRRMTDQMYRHSTKMFNKAPTELTEDEMFYVVAASIGAYNTGEGGQTTMRRLAGYDYQMLYSPNGERWKEYHYKADAELKGAINSKANCTYMKKQYDFYPQLSGGIPFNESGDLSLYNPELWFIVDKNAGKFDGLAENTTSKGTNGVNMNSQFVSEYVDYEDDISKGYSGVVAKVSDDKVKILLDQAVGMIEGKTYLQSMNSSDAFWRDGYDKKYFSDGIASRPPAGYNMEAGIWKDKISEGYFTGDTDAILQLAKIYGKGMFKVINKAVGQMGKPYQEKSAGTMSYDMAGLIWYVFNYGEEGKLFERGKIDEYYEDFKNEVEDGDLRPGDISFFTTPTNVEEKATDAVIYLGNDACVHVSEEVGGVYIEKYSDFKDDVNKRIYLSSKRILKFTQGLAGELNENKNALAGMPEGFVEGDWAFPILFEKKEDIALTDGAGVRQIHPATKRPNIPHFGVDYSGPNKVPIIASKAGVVIRSGSLGSAGEIVVIDHGDGTTSGYYHLFPGTRTVKVGDKVEQGQVVGGMGNSGRGTGTHLHFEIAVGLPNHTRPATGRDMTKFVPIQNMFKELGIRDARKVPHNTIYPGNPAHWDNKNP